MWIHNDEYGGRDNLIHILRIYPLTPRSDFTTVQSTRMQLDDTFNVTLDVPGEYYYVDLIFKDAMKGFITVTE